MEPTATLARENRQQTGLYGAPDEQRDLQAGQIRYALDRDTSSFAEVDVLWPVITHNVEQGDQTSVSFVVHGIGEKYRVRPIESTFATVRHRTKVTKGPGSRTAGLAMAFKLIRSAQDHWRMVNAPHLVALVRGGAVFSNGVLIERPEQAAG